MTVKQSIELDVFERSMDLLHNAPRLIWEMDEITYFRCRQLRDGQGKHLCIKDIEFPDAPGTLFGYDIHICRGKSTIHRLLYLFEDGTSVIIDEAKKR